MWKYFLLLVTIYSVNAQFVNFDTPKYDSTLTQAIIDIITNFYMDKSTTINIFYASEPEADLDEIEGVINEILYKLRDKIIVQIEEYSQMKAPKNYKKWHNIIFCDTYGSFLNIFNKIDPDGFGYQGFYLIAISMYNDEIYSMMKKMFEALWIQHITNVNIVWMPSEDYEEVLMWTYWPYSSSYCGEATPLLHNHYRHGKWLRKAEYFPNKMINLHGNQCTFFIRVFSFKP